MFFLYRIRKKYKKLIQISHKSFVNNSDPKSLLKKRKEKSSLPAQFFSKIFYTKRISLCAPWKGSLTLEAACVLPLFLFAMISILYFVQAIETSVRLSDAFCETSKELGVYAYMKEHAAGEKSRISDIITGGLSSVYAKAQIQKKSDLGKDGGTLSLRSSSFLKSGEMIDLVGSYKVKESVRLLPVPRLKLILRARVRAWTGRDGANGCGSGENGEGALVLITVNGEVYHKNPDCSHIKLSIREVKEDDINLLRNQSGGKYYPCETCNGGHGSVYITDTGNRHHSSLACSGLKRELMLVPISEVKDWRPCSRCG